jgi:hypothetical protein
LIHINSIADWGHGFLSANPSFCNKISTIGQAIQEEIARLDGSKKQ